MPKRLRVSVPLKEDIYNAIELEANKIGCSMATYISFMVGNLINTQNKAIDMIGSSMGSLAKELLDEKAKENSQLKLNDR